MVPVSAFDVVPGIVCTIFIGSLGLFSIVLGIRMAVISSSMYIDIYEDHIEGRCLCEKHGENFIFASGDIVSVEHPASTALVSFVARGRVSSIVFNSQEESEIVYNILINTCSRR